MKKVLFGLLVFLMIGLVGCGGADKKYIDQRKEAEKQLEETMKDSERIKEISKQIDDTTESLEELSEKVGIESENEEVNSTDEDDIDGLRKDLEYATLGEGDVLTNLVIENGEVKATIEIGKDNIIEDKTLLAESLYSSVGDVLLEYDNWEVLTVDFVDIGEISLRRDEKETNEYDMDYFPLEKIIGQLD